MSDANIDPRLVDLATDTGCAYRGAAMKKAIAWVAADRTLQRTFAALLPLSDHNGNGWVDTHEFAASLVAFAEGATLKDLPAAAGTIYRKYEAQWQRENGGR